MPRKKVNAGIKKFLGDDIFDHREFSKQFEYVKNSSRKQKSISISVGGVDVKLMNFLIHYGPYNNENEIVKEALSQFLKKRSDEVIAKYEQVYRINKLSPLLNSNLIKFED